MGPRLKNQFPMKLYSVVQCHISIQPIPIKVVLWVWYDMPSQVIRNNNRLDSLTLFCKGRWEAGSELQYSTHLYVDQANALLLLDAYISFWLCFSNCTISSYFVCKIKMQLESCYQDRTQTPPTDHSTKFVVNSLGVCWITTCSCQVQLLSTTR